MEKQFDFDRFSLPKTKQQLNVVPTPGGSVMKEGMMMSPNFVKGKSGWRLDAEGNFEGNDGTFRGNLEIGGLSITIDTSDNIQNTINYLRGLGGGIIYLKNGTYTLTSDLTLYSNIYLFGTNRNSTILDFVDNTKSVLVQGSSAYSSGTVSINNGSTSLTGASTAWLANVTAGQEILLSGVWYPILSVGSDTTITLALAYGGANLSGATYRIATTISDVIIENLTVKNALYGYQVRYAKDVYIRNQIIQACAKGIYTLDSSLNVYNNIRTIACSEGFNFNNSHLFEIDSLGAIAPQSGNGLTLDTVTQMIFRNIYAIDASADGMNLTSCDDVAIIGTFKTNTGQGIELVSGNNNILISGATVEDNGSDGIKFTATTDNSFVIGTSLARNGGYGINVAASTCDNNILNSNNFDTNTSGAISDSGTNTVRLGNYPTSADGGTVSGTYTPTLTNVANLDGSTAYECQYMRVGNTVTVSGKADVDPTAGATLTQLGISLPITSNIGSEQDCCGTANAAAVASMSGAILGDSANDRAEMRFVSVDTTNKGMYFTFTYQVI